MSGRSSSSSPDDGEQGRGVLPADEGGDLWVKHFARASSKMYQLGELLRDEFHSGDFSAQSVPQAALTPREGFASQDAKLAWKPAASEAPGAGEQSPPPAVAVAADSVRAPPPFASTTEGEAEGSSEYQQDEAKPRAPTLGLCISDQAMECIDMPDVSAASSSTTAAGEMSFFDEDGFSSSSPSACFDVPAAEGPGFARVALSNEGPSSRPGWSQEDGEEEEEEEEEDDDEKEPQPHSMVESSCGGRGDYHRPLQLPKLASLPPPDPLARAAHSMQQMLELLSSAMKQAALDTPREVCWARLRREEW